MSVQQQLYHKVYALADAAQSPEQIKALQQHLSQSLQDNVIPAYVGVPLMQGLTQRLQQATPQAQPARPPVAQQVMQAAQQADMPRQAVAPQRMPAPQGITQGVDPSEGIDQLPSNLPTEGMAQGGIIAFAGNRPDGSLVPDPINSIFDNSSDTGPSLLQRSGIPGLVGAGWNALQKGAQRSVDPVFRAKEYAPEIQVPPSADANALQTPEAKALADKITLDKANSAPKALAS